MFERERETKNDTEDVSFENISIIILAGLESRDSE